MENGKFIISIDSIVGDIVDNLCSDINTKLAPILFKDKTLINSHSEINLKEKFIREQLDLINTQINNSDPLITKYISEEFHSKFMFNTEIDIGKYLTKICKLYLVENHFENINNYYQFISSFGPGEFLPNEKYYGHDVYTSLFSDAEPKIDGLIVTTYFIDIIVQTLRKFELKNLLIILGISSGYKDETSSKPFESELHEGISQTSNGNEKELRFKEIHSKILNVLSDQLTLLIELKIDDHRSKERLSFSACTSEAEKIKYIKKEIKKYQDSISKCPPNIAEYCHGYLVTLSIFDSRLSGDEMYQICSNFIQEEFYELLEDAYEDFPTIEDVNKMDDSFWESFLLYEYEGDDGVLERKNVKSFIKFMALTDRNVTFKEILFEIKEGQKKEKLILDPNKSDTTINDLNSDKSTDLSKNVVLKPSRSNEPKSFTYIDMQSNLAKVTDLMNYLVKKHLIDENTKLSDFRNVFSNNEIVNKIIWTGYISELAYFIKYMHNISCRVEDTKQKQWDITIKCFRMSNNSELTNAKLKGQKVPTNVYILESAVNLL